MSSSDAGEIVELGASELGTVDYWERFYANDLAQLDAGYGDGGDTWFGEDKIDVIRRVMRKHVLARSPHPATATASTASTASVCAPAAAARDSAPPPTGSDAGGARVLDIGCGNGSVTCAIARMRGVACCDGSDVSPQAIALARRLEARAYEQQQQQRDGGEDDADDSDDAAVSDRVRPQFFVDDLFESSVASGAYDVVVDKGTLDAVCLHPETGRAARGRYVDAVWRMLAPAGHLLITSCNFTADELRVIFGERFAERHQVAYPTFRFGGRSGTAVATLLFQRRD